MSPEQTAKLVELLAEIPGVSRMGVILSTSYPGVDRYRSPLERVAASRQHAIRFVEVRAPENLDGALATLRRPGVDGLVVMTDQVMQVRGDEVVRSRLLTPGLDLRGPHPPGSASRRPAG